MRRPRHKLQVSTFPFLAVLLAAMGSLILLLLVMDRRAKLVARNKAQEALAARENKTSAEDEKRRLEWERQRAALHARLEADLQELAGLKNQMEGRETQTLQQLRDYHAQATALEQRLLQEKASLDKVKSDLAKRQAALDQGQAANLATGQAFLTERDKLAQQLAQLEQAWRDLQLLKGRQEHTYSLVAYRGKQGENRQPIYVECRLGGVTFHPDGKTLRGPTWAGEPFRAEVKAQGAALEKTKPPEAGKRKSSAPPLTGPYVLFLVRPEGIDAFYEAASALKGYLIDFGYEFIDAEWLLDFGSGKVAGGWQEAGGRRQEAGGRRQEAGGRRQEAGGVGQEAGGGRQGSGAGSFGYEQGNKGTLVGSGPGSGAGMPGAGGFGGLGSANPNPGQAALPPELRPFPSGSILPAWRPALPPSGVGNGTKIAGKTFAGQPGGTNSGAGNEGDKGSKQVQGETNSQKTDKPPPGAKPGMKGMATGNAQEPPDPFARQPLPGQKSPPSPPPPLSKVLGNRDFIITIECWEKTAEVYPGGKMFAFHAGDARQQAEALVQHVQQLIARRQAGVRIGEPPYRPLLRFQVQPEGLRTYYRAYPPLESLRIPMSRENVEE